MVNPAEDAKCLSAIVESITLAVGKEPIVEGRIVDLLALIPEVLRADPSEQRAVYLLSACNPLSLIVQLTHPSLQSTSINLAALHALLDILTWCAALPGFAAIVEPALARLLTAAGALPAALDALLCGGNAVTAPPAAVLLFVLVARVAAVARALCALDAALERLAGVALRDGAPPAVAEYAAGALRVCAAVDAARLPALIVRGGIAAIAALRSTTTTTTTTTTTVTAQRSTTALVLIAECAAMAAAACPGAYGDVRDGDEAALSALCSLVRQRGAGASLRAALLALLSSVLRRGGPHAAAVARAAAGGSAVWPSRGAAARGAALALAAVGLLPRGDAALRCVALAVAHAIPLLAEVARDGADANREDAARDAALAVAVALVRSPAARRAVRTHMRGNAAAAREFLCVFAAELARAPVALLVDVVMADTVKRPPMGTTDPRVWAQQTLAAQEEEEREGGEGEREEKEKEENDDDDESGVRGGIASDAHRESCTRALLLLACEHSLHADYISDPTEAVDMSDPTQRRFSACRGEVSMKERICGGHSSRSPSQGACVVVSDAALAEAMLSFLPMRFGSYFDRARQLHGPSGVVAQRLHRYEQRSWAMADVRGGELYALFIPFAELTAARAEGEARKAERLARVLSRGLVTTPTSQRGRRWFLVDMVNNILPRTELLLRDLVDMLRRHGHETVVHQLGLIRRIDAHPPGAEKQSEADLGVPHELTVLSRTVFRDVVHSANIMYCISRLRQRFDGGI